MSILIPKLTTQAAKTLRILRAKKHAIKSGLICLTFFFTIMIVFTCQPATAQNPDQEQQSINLINQYIDVAQSDNTQQVQDAWTRLNSNPEALEYMRQKLPQQHYLFQIKGIYLAMLDLQSQRLRSLSDTQEQDVVDFDKTDKSDPVKKFSISSPEVVRQRSNRDIVLDSQNAPLISNRDKALAIPNKDRLVNNQSVDNRVQAMYAAKFQKAPEKIVPSAIAQPFDEAASAVADIRVQGTFVDVALFKYGEEEMRLDVFMNNQPVEQSMDLLQTPESLRLYLQPGMNTLRIKLIQNDNTGFGYFAMGLRFVKTLKGEVSFTWNLQPARDKTLRIEAIP